MLQITIKDLTNKTWISKKSFVYLSILIIKIKVMNKKLVETFDNFVQAAGLYRLKSENAIGSYEFILEEVIELLKKCNENETQLQNDLGVDPIK